MKQSDKTPLWLDLRKEYIDDNFEKLQSYLAECASNPSKKDSFFDTTIELLRARVEDLLNSIASKPIYEDDLDRNTFMFNASLLATYLLVDGKHDLALPAYIAFMGMLRLLNPRFSDSTIWAATRRLRHEDITNLGFSWKDIDKIGTELFAYNAAKLVTFGAPRKKPMIFTKYGTAYISADGLFLTHESSSGAKKIMKDGANSLDTGIGITLRSLSSEKLKQSHESQLQKIEEFIKDFIKLQYKVQNVVPKPTRLTITSLGRLCSSDQAWYTIIPTRFMNTSL